MHLIAVSLTLEISMNTEIGHQPNRHIRRLDAWWWTEFRVGALDSAQLQRPRSYGQEADNVLLLREGKEHRGVVARLAVGKGVLSQEPRDLVAPPLLSGVKETEPSGIFRRQGARLELEW